MANSILKSDVLAIASQLSTMSDATWVMVLAFVNSMEGLDMEPELRKLALCFLAAHLGTLAGTEGASGATTSVIAESAGGLKRTYAQPTASSTVSELGRTTYGQQYLALLNMSYSVRGPILL